VAESVIGGAVPPGRQAGSPTDARFEAPVWRRCGVAVQRSSIPRAGLVGSPAARSTSRCPARSKCPTPRAPPRLHPPLPSASCNAVNASSGGSSTEPSPLPSRHGYVPPKKLRGSDPARRRRGSGETAWHGNAANRFTTMIYGFIVARTGFRFRVMRSVPPDPRRCLLFDSDGGREERRTGRVPGEGPHLRFHTRSRDKWDKLTPFRRTGDRGSASSNPIDVGPFCRAPVSGAGHKKRPRRGFPQIAPPRAFGQDRRRRRIRGVWSRLGTR
jgi:hypothetical protein